MKIAYYKDTKIPVQKYALKKMLSIFGVATPLHRVSTYFGYDEWEIEIWEKEGCVPQEVATEVIRKIHREEPEDYVTELEQSIDFILNA